MNKIILLAVFVLSVAGVQAQNKSLGVGTNTPNPNAALHVESPTGNQGAIMPRLSSAQRLAMSSILGAADAGLLLYDNDLKGLYIWDGTAWQSSAKLQFPVVDTINSIPPNGNALRIVYNGTAVGNFGVAHFENLNPNSGFSAIFGRTNSATNGVADFIVNNPANTNDALGVNTNALNGRAGAFNLNNPGSRNFALYAQSNGDSTGAAVHGNNVGNGFGVFGRSAGSKFASAAVYGEHVGTGDAAGAFRINNAGNPYSALYGETNGNGSAIFGNNLGPVGRAGQFQIGNASNPSAALRGFTSGLGNAAFFTINNIASDTAAVYVTSNGRGHGVHSINNSGATVSDLANATIYGESQGIAANGGSFRITNLANDRAAVFAETFGTGPAIYSRNTGTSGNAASFLVSNSGNNATAMYARTDGTGTAVGGLTTGSGTAGSFEISSPGSTSYALVGRTDGGLLSAGVFGENTGNGFGVFGKANGSALGSAAIYGEQTGTGDAAGAFRINNTANVSNAVYGETNGTASAINANQLGTGRGMIAQINNAVNAQSAFLAQTNGTGPAIVANQSNGGLALDILSGGVKFPVTQLSGNDLIPDNAVVVELTGATQIITLPSGGQNGQAIYVINTGAGASSVGGTNIDPDRGIMFIRLSGSWRAVALSLP